MNLLPALTNEVQAQSAFNGSRVLIKHPGYADAHLSNLLLQFNTVDGHDGILGIQAVLVHTACAIIAANRWDGWLSTSRDPSAVHIDHLGTQVLEAGSYYFHVPPASQGSNAQTPYPIVPNFAEWSFSHDSLPDIWTRPAIAQYIGPNTTAKARDTSCRVTQYIDVTEEAHIVPSSEADWFVENGIDLYHESSTRHGRDRVDGLQNRILLRQDIHTAWDRMNFVIVPKPSVASDRPISTVPAFTTTAAQQHNVSRNDWYWTYHILVESRQLHTKFHNHVLHLLSGVSRESLFARFAWAIFPKMHSFFQRGIPRWVSLRTQSKEEVSEVRLAGETECKAFCDNQGRLRSASPRKKSGSPSKRQRSTDEPLIMQARSKRRRRHNGQERMDFAETESETYADDDDDESSTDDRIRSFTTGETSTDEFLQDENNEVIEYLERDEEEEEEEDDDDPCGFKRRRQVYEESGEGGDHWSLNLEENRGRKRWR